LYTDEDLSRKLVYVEASRGCPFGCEFCLSAATTDSVREFPLEPFFSEMEDLIHRGAKTFKFLDRTFNLNIERSKKIMEFFLYNINKKPFVVHFEMVPSNFPPDLIDAIACFPPNTLRLEIGIQTLNPEVSARIGRPSKPEKELETLRLLAEKTNAIMHVDLIAGLPGENIASFGKGFDALWAALASGSNNIEIQLGILKLLSGAPIARHIEAFGMRFNPLPPYELVETSDIPAYSMDRIKNFARFWELIVNRGLLDIGPSPVFDRFMALSDSLLTRFGRNWGIDKNELLNTIRNE
jgi:radical SAM superfamily enzyme